MKTTVLAVATAALALSACAAPSGGSSAEELGVTCAGKCDGLGTKIKSLYREARSLSRDDLLIIGAGLATDEINDELVWGDVAAEIDEPEFYSVREDLHHGEIVEDVLDCQVPYTCDLDRLVTGIAARYGERELSTEVNRIRREHLRSSDDSAYVEASFELSGNFAKNWSFETGGLADDGFVAVGFDVGGAVETRIVGAFDGDIESAGRAVLASLKEQRGFVMPRSMDDLRDMKPGELIVMRGQGHAGINIGAGVPILVAEPTSWLTYNLVFSAGVRTRLEGKLDIQTVRLEGDELMIDVGVEVANVNHFHVAVEDAWGVTGLVESNVNIAGVNVDLGDLVEGALERELNKQIELVSARYERDSRAGRVNIARFRVRLDQLDENAEEAIAQALKGDVRFAQAESNAGSEAIISEFDLSRSGASVVRHAGVRLFGMAFFRNREVREGSVVIQTPGGARTLLYSSMEEEHGVGFSKHGARRVSLSGLTFDPRRPGIGEGEANLNINLWVDDGYFQRDKMLDHLDSLLLEVTGAEAYVHLSAAGNEIDRIVHRRCDRREPQESCHVDILRGDPNVAPPAGADEVTQAAYDIAVLKQQGMARFGAAIAHFNPELRALLEAAARQKLASQSVLDHSGSTPDATIRLDYRIDDSALSYLFLENDGADFRLALEYYVAASEIDRHDSIERMARDAQRAIDREESRIDRLVAIFDEARDHYEHLIAVENASIEGLGQIGSTAMVVHFPVDRRNAPIYTQASFESISHARALVGGHMFDAMYDLADDHTETRIVSTYDGDEEEQVGVGDIGRQGEDALAYGFLHLVPAEMLDIRYRVDMDTDVWNPIERRYDAAGFQSFDLRARGEGVAPIEAGVFNVDALIHGD